MWKIEEHSQKENRAFISARASEWANFPLFVLEPFIPILFYFAKWWYIIIGAYLLNLLWIPVRYKYFDPKLSEFAWKMNKIKWGVLFGVAIFLFTKKMLVEGIVTLVWPFITLILVMISPPYDIEKMKEIVTKAFSSAQ
ncbi:MAG: hypothetical protein J7L03_06985 [Caldisericaceae bacterium]|nr:hypothetical protein [Caldisericaceae bacterium]